MSKRYVFTIVVFVLWIIGFNLASGFFGEDLVYLLSKIPPSYILGSIGFYALAVGMGIFILYRSLRYAKLKAPIKGVSKAWIFGSFLDNIAPTITPIGEAGMAYFLEKFYRVSYSKSLVGVAIYVSSWGLSVSLFSIMAVILANYFVGLGAFLIPVILIISVFSLITVGWVLLLTKKELVRRIVCKLVVLYNKLYIKLKRRKITFEECVFNPEFEKSYESMKLVMQNKWQIFSSVILFLIPQLAHVLCLYTILLGLGADISFFHVLTIQIVASVAGLMSFIPSGLGVYETVATGSLGGNVPLAMATAAVFLYRLIFVWTTNLIGGFIGISAGIKDPEEIKTVI